MSLKAILVALTLTAAIPAVSQVVPSATQGGLPLRVGGGFSDYQTHVGPDSMLGGALWVDCTPTALPRFLNGLGVEGEARYVTVGENAKTGAGSTGFFRLGTLGGGPTYTVRRWGKVRPYFKFIVNYGVNQMNFPYRGAIFRRETEAAYAAGGGAEYHLFGHLWARGDYEYQMWPNTLLNSNWILDPSGFTAGATWDLGGLHRR
jgi:opacity protein-like surface antigen